MDTPSERRRSCRVRASISYAEIKYRDKEDSMSSVESPKTPKRKDVNIKAKTPKSGSRKAIHSDDDEDFSPKKLRNNRTPSAKALESITLENSPTIAAIDKPMRRSTRIRTPNKRFDEIDQLLTGNMKGYHQVPTKRDTDEDESEEVIELNSISSDDEESEKENALSKPTTLFNEEYDVDGKELYSFKTPKKKDGMSNLASQTPKTPRHNDPNKSTPKTPKNLRISEIQKTPTSRPSAGKCTKTPRHIRDEIKKKLYKVKYQEESDDGDFSASDSEFELSSDVSSEADSYSSDETEEQPKKKESVAARVLKTPSTSLSTRALRASTRSKTSNYQYVLQSDDFFSKQTSKSKTSDNTLDRLKNPRLPHGQLIKLFAKMELSKEHEQAIKEMNEGYKGYFYKWMMLFDQGFTVLLHGLGSKRNLLQVFHKEMLAEEHVLVVNGFFPSLTVKDILEQIANDLLELSASTANSHETVNMIEEEMKQIPALRIFIIIHNIDGVMLRNDTAQSVLCRLATIKNIHIIASIDHINAPLLWNNTKLNNYNFVWFDVTSYLPYSDETAFENSLLINNSGALELSSMKSVFQSLTSNAKGIYMLLMKYQLKNNTKQNYHGIQFKDLYSACRESFLVSSDVALRAQLTEFLDHKLARLKRGADGAENITIPISNTLLQKFMNEQSSN